MKDSLVRNVNWLAPWAQTGAEAVDLEDELRREVGPGHPLHGIPVTAVARRIDDDDVLFELTGASSPFAVVHLSWSGRREADTRWPSVEFFSGFGEWVDGVMAPDHRGLET